MDILVSVHNFLTSHFPNFFAVRFIVRSFFRNVYTYYVFL